MPTKSPPKPVVARKAVPVRPPRGKVHSAFASALRGAWRSTARPEQLAPAGDWTIWAFNGGRGAGKTRSGAEWITERVQTGRGKYIHLVAPTAADCRDVMIEGPAGILSISPSHMRPLYQPSLRKLVWPNGAQALLFSSDEPDRLRGPQADTVWIDELCAMRLAQDVLDTSLLGLRLGRDPRMLITTTPRPIKCFKALLAREGQDVVVTRSSSYANRDNLAPAFFAQIVARYEGTRLGKQEIEAQLLVDVPGSLWQLERIEELRVNRAPEQFERVVVAIDPAATFGDDSDETGLIVVGLAADGAAYVLEDLSGKYPPAEWAQRAIHAYRIHRADRIIGEVNNGGAMVEHTLRSVDAGIPFRAVHASRGKLVRAEPISALYEQGRVHHVGNFAKLEDQMCSYDGSRSGGSPDRLDALVWGLTELVLGAPPGGFFKEGSLLARAPDPAGGMIDAVPIAMPQPVDSCFAVIGTAANSDAVGVVYFALCEVIAPQQLVVTDWDLWQFDGVTLQERLAAVAERLTALRLACRPLSARGGIWIDQTPIGAALLAHGAEKMIEVADVSAHIVLPADATARALSAGRFVGAGLVKIAQPAHEKVSNFAGVTRNHLLSQVLAFGIGGEQQAAELLSAFCTGCILALDKDPQLA